MSLKFSNNASTVLLEPITKAANTLKVVSGTGNKFPVTEGGHKFQITVADVTGRFEIMTCVLRAGDTFTVFRAQEGTTALDFGAGSLVENRVTAAFLNDVGGGNIQTTDLNIYISKSGNDTNSGASENDAVLTINRALDIASGTSISRNGSIVFKFGPGDWDTLAIRGNMFSCGNILITSITNVPGTTANHANLPVFTDIACYTDKFDVYNVVSNRIFATEQAFVTIIGYVRTASFQCTHGGRINFAGNNIYDIYKKTDNPPYAAFYAERNSLISAINASTIFNFVEDCAFPGATAYCTYAGSIIMHTPAVTFTGAAQTCPNFISLLDSVITVGGTTSKTWFPGNGTYRLETGGKYCGTSGDSASDSLSIGSAIVYTGTTVPAGYLPLKGGVVLKSAYPELYAAMGDSYRRGEVPTGYFMLPNLAPVLPLFRDIVWKTMKTETTQTYNKVYVVSGLDRVIVKYYNDSNSTNSYFALYNNEGTQIFPGIGIGNSGSDMECINKKNGDVYFATRADADNKSTIRIVRGLTSGNAAETGFPPAYSPKMALNSINGDLFAMGTKETMLKVLRGGTGSWVNVGSALNGGIVGLDVNPTNGDVWVCGSSGAGTTVIRVLRGGTGSWTTVVTTALPDVIKVNPNNNDVWFAGSSLLGVIRGGISSGVENYTIDNYLQELTINPTTNDVFFAGNKGSGYIIPGGTGEFKEFPSPSLATPMKDIAVNEITGDVWGITSESLNNIPLLYSEFIVRAK